jgi:hypothetical protein
MGQFTQFALFQPGLSFEKLKNSYTEQKEFAIRNLLSVTLNLVSSFFRFMMLCGRLLNILIAE